MVDKSSNSLEHYFRDEENSENFFDQLSSNTSAMMTSMIESKSSQDFFATDAPVQSLASEVSSLQLDCKRSEPVVCKIFSQEPSTKKHLNDKTFFDIISPQDQNHSTDSTSKIYNSVVSDHSDALSINEGPYPSPLQGFEGISDAMNGAESDRTREAWIPSEKTRRALIMAATSSQTSYTPDKDSLTTPGVIMEEEMVDGVTQLVKQLFGEAEASHRRVLTANDVSQDERGLRELIQADCFRAAVNLTGRLLTIFGQGLGRQGQPTRHSPHSVQLWFTRFCLLVKLGAFQIVESEASVWWDLDKPDLYYQFYPELYGGKLGTMVPFQMRLLLATLPAYLKKCSVALERLYSVLATVHKILHNLESGKSEDGSLIELSARDRDLSKQVWSSREARVQHAIINVALMSKNYILAIEIFQKLIENNPSSNQKRALHSALGRVFLQMGDIINAEKCFFKAKQLKRTKTGTLSSNTADIRELVDRGLVLVAQNKFDDAYEHFQKASLLEPTNVMVLNNMAVCLLYTGKLKEALNLLSSTVHSHPTLALQEPVLLNICTLFELGSSHMAQKEDLLRQVAKYRGDSFNVSCLKLSTKQNN
ncbi:trafficking protein particle complex subunit 12 [Rhodnius prolixus]|uniref:Putative d-alanyl-d-alanine carboxypeptidase rhodnius neglectus n=1 Tax=Rhodnius prolixus TaxID=13249 RepID=A0A4P6DA46_RHOPR